MAGAEAVSGQSSNVVGSVELPESDKSKTWQFQGQSWTVCLNFLLVVGIHIEMMCG